MISSERKWDQSQSIAQWIPECKHCMHYYRIIHTFNGRYDALFHLRLEFHLFQLCPQKIYDTIHFVHYNAQVDKQTQLTTSSAALVPNKSTTHSTGAPVPNSTPSKQTEPSSSSLLASPSNKYKQSTTSHATENLVAGNSVPTPNQTTSPSAIVNKYHQPTNTTNLIPGYPFGYNDMMSMWIMSYCIDRHGRFRCQFLMFFF